jgi:phage gpG-like protein
MHFVILDFGTPQKLSRKMVESSELASSMEPVMIQIAADMLETERVIFQAQGRRGGGSWRSLKPDTIRRKGSGTRILFTSEAHHGYGSGTDALYRSVTQVGAPNQILQIDKNSVTLGTTRPYAKAMQEGSPHRNIPARPFMTFLPSDIDRWERMIAKRIVKPFVIG